MVYSLKLSECRSGGNSPRYGLSYGHSMERSSFSMGSFFPASRSKTFMPWVVRTCAAMPPAAPDPTTTASYVLVRSAGDSAIEEALLVATRHRLARVPQGYTASPESFVSAKIDR